MRGWRLACISRMPALPAACAWMALLCAIHLSPGAEAGDDAAQIRRLIAATWDNPDSKVATDPVVVSRRHAVASWTQGDRGGRALLRREDDTGWSVVLCSGDPLTQADRLVEAGVPHQDAAQLVQALAAAEAHLPQDRRAKFSSFEGVVSGGDHAGRIPHAPSHPVHP